MSKLTYEELEARCSALAVENAGLKAAAEFSIAPDMWVEQADGMLDYRYVDWYVDVLKAAMQTPATDAFLAEVRAQTWCEAKEFTKAILETECLEDLNMLFDCIDVLFDEKVQQLRKGGAQ